MTFYRIRDWERHFENNRTRELKRMDWVPIPNKHDGSGFTQLLNHANGMAHLGAWLIIVQIASKCDPRGTLSHEGAGGVRTPLTSHLLAVMSHGSAVIFDEAIPRLVTIGWLETYVNPAPSCGPSAAPSCGKVPMEWNGMERNGTEQHTPLPPRDGKEIGGVAFELRKLIGKAFQHERWNYAEEYALSEIASGDAAIRQWAKIEDFRSRVPRNRLNVEGVATVLQVLNHWGEILDKVNGGYDPYGPQKPDKGESAKKAKDDALQRQVDRLVKEAEKF